ncbi:hypothetical protein L1987_08359 [Smallanthus sonchifolius]|uniref:Uncharacterized protein n=1 Tax=Smallanthus sonchifolius TaxID=185202 RepID=A0ACB9JM56_9ASTR|nr:hypothetical protein L1987_08359 [Smallanthus sonchifolius]
MEDTLKDQSSVSGNKGGGMGKLLRYPLRSATKSKDEKPPASVPSSASASRRVRPSSSVSQSVSVLDLSSKEKSVKPLRRLSIPTKPTARPTSQSAKSITPISEARANRSRSIDGKSDTSVSDVSRTLSRRKFSVLSSASYWLSHIKLCEAAGKHQLSLGFFKLAQEAACENPQLLRDGLKSYALRYNIIDLGESAQEILQSYEISDNIVQGTRSSSEDAQSLSSVNGIHKPKPKSSTNNIGSVAKESVKENYQKKLVSNTKASTNVKITNQHSASEAGSRKIQKNFQKPIKKEFNKEKQMVKSKGKKSANEDIITCPEEAVTEENKENMDASPVEEISLEI